MEEVPETSGVIYIEPEAGAQLTVQWVNGELEPKLAMAKDQGMPMRAIVIDSLKAGTHLLNGGDGHAQNINPGFGALEKVAEAFQLAIIVVHHGMKPKTYKGEVQSKAGLNAKLDAIMDVCGYAVTIMAACSHVIFLYPPPEATARGQDSRFDYIIWETYKTNYRGANPGYTYHFFYDQESDCFSMEEPHEAKVARAMARVHTSSRPTLDAAADFILNEMYVEVTGSGVNAIEWSLVEARNQGAGNTFKPKTMRNARDGLSARGEIVKFRWGPKSLHHWGLSKMNLPSDAKLDGDIDIDALASGGSGPSRPSSSGGGPGSGGGAGSGRPGSASTPSYGHPQLAGWGGSSTSSSCEPSVHGRRPAPPHMEQQQQPFPRQQQVQPVQGERQPPMHALAVEWAQQSTPARASHAQAVPHVPVGVVACSPSMVELLQDTPDKPAPPNNQIVLYAAETGDIFLDIHGGWSGGGGAGHGMSGVMQGPGGGSLQQFGGGGHNIGGSGGHNISGVMQGPGGGSLQQFSSGSGGGYNMSGATQGPGGRSLQQFGGDSSAGAGRDGGGYSMSGATQGPGGGSHEQSGRGSGAGAGRGDHNISGAMQGPGGVSLQQFGGSGGTCAGRSGGGYNMSGAMQGPGAGSLQQFGGMFEALPMDSQDDRWEAANTQDGRLQHVKVLTEAYGQLYTALIKCTPESQGALAPPLAAMCGYAAANWHGSIMPMMGKMNLLNRAADLMSEIGMIRVMDEGVALTWAENVQKRSLFVGPPANTDSTIACAIFFRMLITDTNLIDRERSYTSATAFAHLLGKAYWHASRVSPRFERAQAAFDIAWRASHEAGEWTAALDQPDAFMFTPSVVPGTAFNSQGA